MTRSSQLRVFVVAGEESGDHLGAGLMAALSEQLDGAVTYSGVGGLRMSKHGLTSLFPMQDIALHGLLQVVPHIPRVLSRIGTVVRAVGDAKPDIVVLIDAPGFNLRVARRIRRLYPDLPIVDYVSPTVWAYAPWRARRMAAFIDLVLAILPFEPEEHRKLGGPQCVYVGHPLVKTASNLRPGAGERSPLAEGAPRRLLILPGSRRSEIRRLMPVFGRTLALVRQQQPGLEAVLPVPPDLREEVEAGLAGWPVQPSVVSEEHEKQAAFRAAHAALAASGTVSVELALAGVPMVIAYRLDPVVRLLKPFLKAHSIVLANLILGRNVVPEFLDRQASPARLAAQVLPLLDETTQRRAQVEAFAELDQTMAVEGASPSDRAAAHIVELARSAVR